MQPEITIHDYPCGSGKTTAMIKSFKEDRKYIVILPLLSEVDRVVETATKVRFSQPSENDNEVIENYGHTPQLFAGAIPHWEIAKKYNVPEAVIGLSLITREG